jgi:protein-disulfide isomerase
LEAINKNGWLALGLLACGYALASSAEGHDLIGGLVGALCFAAALIQRSTFHGVLITSALCLGCNVYLLNNKWAAQGSESKCNINDVLNCDIINQSAASELFGIPITLFGSAYFLGLLFAGLASERDPKPFYSVLGLFSSLSVVYSAWLGYQSKLIGAFCVVCATIYVGNALLLWAAAKGAREHEASLFDNIGVALQTKAFKVLAAVFVLVTGIGALSQPTKTNAPLPKTADATNPVDFIASLYQKPRGSITMEGSGHQLGDPNARYLVVEFADFGCPHCAIAETEMTELIKQHPDVQLHFKPYPLASQCNEAIDFDEAPERCRAAAAAECSGEQGKYFEMAHQLFANQGYFNDNDLNFMAKALKLDMDAFRACMDAPETNEKLKASAAAGNRADIHGTPAMFLRGVFGDDFIEVPRGAAGILRIIEAHKDGLDLPSPKTAESHHH